MIQIQIQIQIPFDTDTDTDTDTGALKVLERYFKVPASIRQPSFILAAYGMVILGKSCLGQPFFKYRPIPLGIQVP